jgi:hypothetical protein
LLRDEDTFVRKTRFECVDIIAQTLCDLANTKGLFTPFQHSVDELQTPILRYSVPGRALMARLSRLSSLLESLFQGSKLIGQQVQRSDPTGVTEFEHRLERWGTGAPNPIIEKRALKACHERKSCVPPVFLHIVSQVGKKTFTAQLVI